MDLTHLLDQDLVLAFSLRNGSPHPGVVAAAADLKNATRNLHADALLHLLREIEKTEQEFADSPEVARFCQPMADLVSEAMRLRNRPIDDFEYRLRARQIKRRIEDLVAHPASHLAAQAIQDLFRRNAHRLYHWVEDRRVPAENNAAERELRPTVIARKVSFGSQSEAGARTRSRIMTVLYTVKKRLKDSPLEVEVWLKTVLNQLTHDPKLDGYSLLPGTRN